MILLGGFIEFLVFHTNSPFTSLLWYNNQWRNPLIVGYRGNKSNLQQFLWLFFHCVIECWVHSSFGFAYRMRTFLNIDMMLTYSRVNVEHVLIILGEIRSLCL
jgi:hypothetical protein